MDLAQIALEDMPANKPARLNAEDKDIYIAAIEVLKGALRIA